MSDMFSGIMKTLITMFGLLLCGTNVQAQKESVSASMFEFDSSSVRITNGNIIENCAARFAIDVAVHGFEITVVETDTVYEKAFCKCGYYVSAFVKGLPPGTYSVSMYRQYRMKYIYPEDKKILIGSAQLVVPLVPFGVLSVNVYQSECGSGSIYDGRRSFGEMQLHSFPNPATSDVTLQIKLYQWPDEIMVLVVDDCGRRLAPPVVQTREEWSLELYFPFSLFPHSGIYYCMVTSNGRTKTLPITILK